MQKIGINKVIGERGSSADIDNNILGHEQFFYDDGANVGYGNTGTMTNESISEYSQFKYYDDTVLRLAVNNVQSTGNYTANNYSTWWGNNNCQDFGSAVDLEYNRLIQTSH